MSDPLDSLITNKKFEYDESLRLIMEEKWNATAKLRKERNSLLLKVSPNVQAKLHELRSEKQRELNILKEKKRQILNDFKQKSKLIRVERTKAINEDPALQQNKEALKKANQEEYEARSNYWNSKKEVSQ